MFTGLVQSVGTVLDAAPSAAGLRLTIDASAWSHRPAPGDSISVSGCCLTVAAGSDPQRGRLVFDAVAETLSKTTLGRLAPGSRVNLEHAVRADTLMGGHFVQGHVDGVGVVEHVRDDPADWRVRVRAPAELALYFSPKGSVAVEGVSLTIAAADGPAFEVALIPTTLELTTLRALRPGDGVNIEADMLAKQVVHALRAMGALPGR